MDETTKSKRLWGPLEHSVLTGKGIDIGCGPDPVTPGVRGFDVNDGDANRITDFVKEDFDFVYASHCLEHMHEPRKAVLEWWKLVRPGGHLFFMVPDEDLYEQGVFPSRFNPDHKATFTISKDKSWSPVSINVLELAQSLPNGQIVKLALQDQGYDRRMYKHGSSAGNRVARFALRYLYGIRRRTGIGVGWLERFFARYATIDQTRSPEPVAQIQCIVKKLA
jgi:SAM-dependent methyltransferase